MTNNSRSTSSDLAVAGGGEASAFLRGVEVKAVSQRGPSRRESA